MIVLIDTNAEFFYLAENCTLVMLIEFILIDMLK